MKLPDSVFKHETHRPTYEHESVPITRRSIPTQIDPTKHIVHVPVHGYIELDTDHCLRQYEAIGGRVDRSKGSSAIDLARNLRASDAVVQGFDSLLFVDADMMFTKEDIIRIFARPEPLVAGAYPAKRVGPGAQLNVNFFPDTTEILMGDWATQLYPVRHVGAGFMRIKTSLLKRLIVELKLPRVRMANSFGWPFFMPIVETEPDGKSRYLCEDYAFCHRCNQIGVTPLLDTSFRLFHLGTWPYGWEEVGTDFAKKIQRNANLTVGVDITTQVDTWDSNLALTWNNIPAS